jgi:GNAT superfamily N-acetyltransferase
LNDKLTFRLATIGEITDLRHRILRAGLPRQAANFPGDELPTSRHFAAFNGQTALCCATFHLERYKNQPAWRLRGMATDDGFRSKGIGKSLLTFAEAELFRENPIRLFWCNARAPAVRFYESQNWKIVSDVFDIPTAGPHYVMLKRCAQ